MQKKDLQTSKFKIMADIDITDYYKLYKELLNDSNFEELEIELQKPNIFNILGIGRMEIRHSNFLVWLLDPKGSHSLGNRFLIRVLRDLAINKDNPLNITEINKLNFNNVEISREVRISHQDKNGFIDILIVFKDESDNLVICIENKIDTTNSKEQLEKYEGYINKTYKKEDNQYFTKILVYLTPLGNGPIEYKGNDVWILYSYKEIISHLENLQKSTLNTTVNLYISDYLLTLKREIMGTQDKASELATTIYNDNREIFQFVYDNMSDDVRKQSWENKNWITDFGKRIENIAKKEEQDATYELGFTKTYVSIKRNKKKIYSIMERSKPNCAMDIDFAANEDKDSIKKAIIELLEKVQSRNGDLDKLSWIDSAYFSINYVNLLSDETLEEIHRIRFSTN